MDLSTGVSLGQMLLALGTMLVAGATAWGGLLQRVKTLEREVAALAGFAERLTRIEEKTTNIKESLDQITGSWLFREPPTYGEPVRTVTPRRRT